MGNPKGWGKAPNPTQEDESKQEEFYNKSVITD